MSTDRKWFVSIAIWGADLLLVARGESSLDCAAEVHAMIGVPYELVKVEEAPGPEADRTRGLWPQCGWYVRREIGGLCCALLDGHAGRHRTVFLGVQPDAGQWREGPAIVEWKGIRT